MCGRFTLRTAKITLLKQWEIARDETPELPPRYNLAPAQSAPVVVAEGPARVLRMMSWGLVPAWAPDAAGRNINARCESLRERPLFRGLVDRHRALIPADGFYEWSPPAPGRRIRQPWHITRFDGAPFAFAGLWTHRSAPDGVALDSFTILTGPPNAEMRAVHDRMPILLTPADAVLWLDPDRPFDRGPADILRPLPDGCLRLTAVSTAVNSPCHDGPECLAPPDAPPGGDGRLPGF